MDLCVKFCPFAWAHGYRKNAILIELTSTMDFANSSEINEICSQIIQNDALMGHAHVECDFWHRFVYSFNGNMELNAYGQAYMYALAVVYHYQVKYG